MKDIHSPTSLAKSLTELFPAFANELQGEDVTSYHQVVLLLTPVVTEYLHNASVQTVKEFCGLISGMVAEGGEKEKCNLHVLAGTCLADRYTQDHSPTSKRGSSARASLGN
jgi:hypothetical protein